MKSFLGIEIHPATDKLPGRAIVRCCAWCFDKKKTERCAENLGLEVSHGICVDCGIQMQRQNDIYRS